MLVRISFFSLLFGTALFAAAVNAVTEQALICHGCNYEQAQNLAKSNAEPATKCEDNSGAEITKLKGETCLSQPKKIVIFDALTRQAYPFEVYHAKQGGNISDLRSSIATSDSSVAPEVMELLNTGVDMHTELMNSQDDIVERLVSDLNSGKIKLN